MDEDLGVGSCRPKLGWNTAFGSFSPFLCCCSQLSAGDMCLIKLPLSLFKPYLPPE